MQFLAEELFLELIVQIKPHMHICPSSRTFRYLRKFGFRPILGWWRSIRWRFSAIFNFGATEPNMTHFLLYLRTLFYQAHLLSPLKIWELGFPEKYKVFMEPPLYHSTRTYIAFAVRKNTRFSRNPLYTIQLGLISSLLFLSWSRCILGSGVELN